jgi:hypothetical protein
MGYFLIMTEEIFHEILEKLLVFLSEPSKIKHLTTD